MPEVPRNRLILNVPLGPGEPCPEPDLPMLSIDGTPIHNIQAINLICGNGRMTAVTFAIECEVGGFVGTYSAADLMKKASE